MPVSKCIVVECLLQRRVQLRRLVDRTLIVISVMRYLEEVHSGNHGVILVKLVRLLSLVNVLRYALAIAQIDFFIHVDHMEAQ